MSDILFLAHRVPFPPNRGDTIRSAQLLKELAKIGSVHVGCFSDETTENSGEVELDAMAKSCRIVKRSKPLVLAGAEAVLSGKPVSLTAFHSGALEAWVRQTCAQHDIGAIVVFSGQMGQYIPQDFAGRVIVDLCDVDSAKFESYAAQGDRVWLNAREARLLAEVEEALAQRADATVLITQAEAHLFQSRLNEPEKAHIHVIGNGIDAELFDPAKVTPHPSLSGESGCHFVFTGQMDYRPNEAAALWAIEHFLPCVRQRDPLAQLHIVGRSPTAELQSRAGLDGLTIWGEVPDVKPFVAAADCVIAPLLIARGVQNKVLEAMAMARPVLLTPDAATGLAANDGQHWMVSPPDGEAMANRFFDLRNTRGASQAMGEAARRFVLDHHAWEAMLSPLRDLVHGKANVLEHSEARNAA